MNNRRYGYWVTRLCCVSLFCTMTLRCYIPLWYYRSPGRFRLKIASTLYLRECICCMMLQWCATWTAWVANSAAFSLFFRLFELNSSFKNRKWMVTAKCWCSSIWNLMLRSIRRCNSCGAVKNTTSCGVIAWLPFFFFVNTRRKTQIQHQ